MDDPVLALLVTLLPNLKKLDLQAESLLSADLFFQMIRRISTASSTFNSSISLLRLTEGTVPLTTLDFGTGGFLKTAWVWPFFLPSHR